MRITADTNVLLRAVLDDHPVQGHLARAALAEAEHIAITLATLCEVVWVLRKNDRRSISESVGLLQQLLSIPNLSLDQAAVEAGVAILRDGGDFADGVIAFEGRRLGGAIFTTFDQEAAALLQKAGEKVKLLA